MLKSLYPAIDWPSIKIVGFDLDGTLYDEFDFIVQVYRPIAAKIAEACGTAASDEVYRRMIWRWLEKGSSYNRIFEEALLTGGLKSSACEIVVGECLSLFKDFRPVLQLSGRVSALLDYFSERLPLFLVTDGSCRLQQAKIDALDLAQWFRPENIFISGCWPGDVSKPATSALDHIGILEDRAFDPAEVVFFGDRSLDREFAKAAGFRFVEVREMWVIGDSRR